MKLTKYVIPALLVFALISCDVTDSDSGSSIETPETYEFTRNGESTVSFSGQTTRLEMASELTGTMLDFDGATEELLLRMYRNQTAEGNDADPFSSASLNQSTKSVKGKVAASADYFSLNASESVQIKNLFEEWISAQIDEVFPNENQLAEVGVPGQIADGSSTRYVNAKGFEYNQLVGKSLIGALMTDQMLNNYLSTAVLDAGENRANNDNGVLDGENNYTTMEHKWDEAYGYLFGGSPNPANPLATLGEDDDFLNKYLGRVEGDEDFEGIAQEIFDAFALGRAAIVEGDYELRDEQAQIIRQRVSEVIGIRAVYYLQSAINVLDQGSPAYGTAFHDLSEAYGFIYSLKFTRVPNTDQPYVTAQEVDEYLAQLSAGNGLWEVAPETLNQISISIADKFEFSLEAASN